MSCLLVACSVYGKLPVSTPSVTPGFDVRRVPQITARLVGADHAIVEGSGFTAATVLVVEVGVDRAHQPTACAGELRREVETSRWGRFRIDIEPAADRGCDFTCGEDRAPLRAFIGDRLQSAQFPCWHLTSMMPR